MGGPPIVHWRRRFHEAEDDLNEGLKNIQQLGSSTAQLLPVARGIASNTSDNTWNQLRKEDENAFELGAVADKERRKRVTTGQRG